MRRVYEAMLIASAIALTACSDTSTPDSGGASPAAPAAEAPSAAVDSTTAESTAAAPAQASESGGSATIDHARDEREFELRSAIAGWEEILADQKDSGADTSFATEHLAELKSELAEL